jgi:hypothetical protein
MQHRKIINYINTDDQNFAKRLKYISAVCLISLVKRDFECHITLELNFQLVK